MADALFTTIERLQGAAPWGATLDAGTGDHSLSWLCGLPTERWTAITGDGDRGASMRGRFLGRTRPQDRILSGNWTDPTLLEGEVYDTVLADYLLGALDGFAPYYQDRLFSRLRPLVGRRLYVVGLAPYPDVADTPGGRAVLEIARLRDACILLAGHRCYREYPMDWVIRHLEAADFAVLDAIPMPIVYRERFFNGQLDVAKSKLPLFADPNLAAEMGRHIEETRARTLALSEVQRGVNFGEDYIVAAEPSTRGRR